MDMLRIWLQDQYNDINKSIVVGGWNKHGQSMHIVFTALIFPSAKTIKSIWKNSIKICCFSEENGQFGVILHCKCLEFDVHSAENIFLWNGVSFKLFHAQKIIGSVVSNIFSSFLLYLVEIFPVLLKKMVNLSQFSIEIE